MFKHLIAIEPLGLLYGSLGKFLSPENLVGRSGAHFPPSAATLSGVFAAAYAGTNQLPKLHEDLQLAGPFWAMADNPQDFYVPLPFNCLVKDGVFQGRQQWSTQAEQWLPSFSGKFDSRRWVALSDWDAIAGDDDAAAAAVSTLPAPWQFVPHLHPKLATDQRRVDTDSEGSLFLENAVQLPPNVCLVYLSSLPIQSGWYRFGGEGHMVDLSCLDLAAATQARFQQSLGHSFALITPAVWGSNRFSYRVPTAWGKNTRVFTQRPVPFRYRLGGEPQHPKRLSRGRYAVPAGTVYITEDEKSAWLKWSPSWFPKEGPHMNRWGCGLALPLPSAVASDPVHQPAIS